MPTLQHDRDSHEAPRLLRFDASEQALKNPFVASPAESYPAMVP